MPYKRSGKFPMRGTRKGGYVRKAFKGKRKFFKGSSGSNGRLRGGGDVSRTTTLVFKQSFLTRQPIPDRYFCWLNCFMTGATNVGVGSNTGTWQIKLNALTFPFNTGSPMPNPIQAVNVTNPAGLKNLLFNSTTSTGLWGFYRVHRVRVSHTFQPQTAGDNCTCGIAPLINTGGYGGLITLSQGPNAKTIVTTIGGTGANDTLYQNIDVAAALGIKKELYAANVFTTAGSFAAPPTQVLNLQAIYNTIDNSVLTAPLQYAVRLQFLVEFFERIDTALIDS